MPGKVFLVPTVLSADALFSLPPYITDTVRQLRIFYVENERTARRFLKALDRSIDIDSLQLHLMNEHNPPDLPLARKLLQEGHSIGVISEAGCPAIADPGQLVVQAAHSINAAVVPLVGPNSMLLALMASGMNGQHFQFVGYLPVKPPDRAKAIKELEAVSAKKQQTQLFIEAPYRNNQLLKDILANCNDRTQLCVAADLTGPTEYIRTQSVAQWKKQTDADFHKRPAIFLLYAG
ncbi:SAM-dependent methyltransferase [Chitinophaga sp. GCM10012297]|uniref:SAM-dependent methyltransferase n=1 Tax=Chitinophaga chungangae TaxID=2821488 RepID=A0ABS3YG37_9BACT|nr:SAM-dependent methyltransferase [Chitinophaga chungangae]MBO9153415.1 SAM-dependent methyltransferase [Chitinophaga chungangae]